MWLSGGDGNRAWMATKRGRFVARMLKPFWSMGRFQSGVAQPVKSSGPVLLTRAGPAASFPISNIFSKTFNCSEFEITKHSLSHLQKFPNLAGLHINSM
jgi:hypothetical protein